MTEIIQNNTNQENNETVNINPVLDPLFKLNYKYCCTDMINQNNVNDIRFRMLGKYPW